MVGKTNYVNIFQMAAPENIAIVLNRFQCFITIIPLHLQVVTINIVLLSPVCIVFKYFFKLCFICVFLSFVRSVVQEILISLEYKLCLVNCVIPFTLLSWAK